MLAFEIALGYRAAVTNRPASRPRCPGVLPVIGRPPAGSV
jgi:hypothetical protein